MSETLHCTSYDGHACMRCDRPMIVDGAIQTLRECREPCDNEECDVCYPIPRWKISTERVQRLFYERKIKAATEAEALAIYNDGTAWPSSYDDRHAEILEQHAPIVTRVPPLDEPLRSRLRHAFCYHNLPSAKVAP